MGRIGGAQRGYSVLETITAVSLAIILSAVAFPVATALHRQYSLVSAANQLGFDIMRARMQAASQAQFVRIRLYDSSRYGLEQSADGLAFELAGGVVSLPPGVSAESAGTGGPAFDPSGLGATLSVITLSNGEAAKTLTTNVLGRVTVS